MEGEGGEGIPRGLLEAETAMVFSTSDTPPGREAKVFGDPLEALRKRCVFEFCGVTRFYRRTFGVMVTSAPEQRRSWLQEARSAVSTHFPG